MIAVSLPLPNAALNPNARPPHIRTRSGKVFSLAKSEEFAAAKSLAWAETMNALRANPAAANIEGPLALRMLFCMPVIRDLDNAAASAKAYVDGVLSALGRNDRDIHEIVLVKRPGRDGHGVVINVGPLE